MVYPTVMAMAISEITVNDYDNKMGYKCTYNLLINGIMIIHSINEVISSYNWYFGP